MAEQVGSATASGSVARPGSGTTGTGTAESGAGTAAGRGDGSDEVTPFVSQVPGTPVFFPTFHGRAVSWVAVSLVMIAFAVGGLALVFGPIWWLFWASIGLAVVGLLLAAATGIFDDWY